MLTKSSTELVRQRNSVLVLSVLRRHGALAHTEISDFTGLSSATISAITTELEKAQIIEKSEHQLNEAAAVNRACCFGSDAIAAISSSSSSPRMRCNIRWSIMPKQADRPLQRGTFA